MHDINDIMAVLPHRPPFLLIDRIEELEPGLWLIRGSASLEDVAEVLDLPLPDEECDTFGGFVFAAYGSVPEDGTVFHLQAGGMNIEVLEISGHKLELAKVRRLSEKEDQALSTGEK